LYDGVKEYFMRIAIIASGSRGDVEPYIALGKGLAQARHHVRLVTHQDFENLIEGQDPNLTFWPVEGRVRDVAEGMGALLERGNFLAILAEMSRQAQTAGIYLARAGLAACEGVDMILTGLGGIFVGAALAEKFNLPLVQAYYIPFTPTRAYPSFLVPRPPVPLGAPFNRLSYSLARQVMWQSFRPADRAARRDVLGLRPAPLLANPFDHPCTRKLPILYGYSPAVIPPPPDWGPEIHVTGYWFQDSVDSWTPPPALLDFLAAGPPPVYVGFGSMSSTDPRATASLVLDALRQSGQRAIMLAGWGGLAAADAPASVFMVDAVPFAWLFPRVAAVVHHGGAGTTGLGLRAGTPSVIVPFFGDQPYWAQRVADLGAGPRPIPRRRLTAARLASAITAAVSDPGIRGRAAELGARIRAEDGVGAAVAVINRLGPT
jgi:UDP:flavonoid glycosyltransferase YjiC (YdhE family)